MAWLSRLRLPPLVASRAASYRSFGSAAAVEFDYDSDDEYYYRDDLRLAKPRLGFDGSEPESGIHWVLMGAPGAWRHAFAERLSKLLEVPHISMGTLVQQELNPRSSLYKEIASAINEGKHVPERVVFALLSKRLEEGYGRGEMGFILDGFPRTSIQARLLDEMAHIDLVVNLKCSEEHLAKLNAGKEAITTSRQELLRPMLPSAAPIEPKKESVGIYREEVQALEEYYRKQRKLVEVKVGESTSAETWEGLLAALHLKRQATTTATTSSCQKHTL